MRPFECQHSAIHRARIKRQERICGHGGKDFGGKNNLIIIATLKRGDDVTRNDLAARAAPKAAFHWMLDEGFDFDNLVFFGSLWDGEADIVHVYLRFLKYHAGGECNHCFRAAAPEVALVILSNCDQALCPAKADACRDFGFASARAEFEAD